MDDNKPDGGAGIPQETKEAGAQDKTKMCGDMYDPMPLNGATSFAEVAEIERTQEAVSEIGELTWQFGRLANNIIAKVLMDETITDKTAAMETALTNLAGEFADLIGQAMQAPDETKSGSVLNWVKSAFRTKAAQTKREGGEDFPAGDYAYVPDPNKPSTWKIRLTETPGKPTVAQLGRAAAAFSSGGFRGNKAQMPAKDIAGVKARIRSEYKKLGVKPEDIPDSVKENGLMFWKEADTEQYRWLAIYSNCYRDNDKEPEIISSEAHRDFVKAVDNGEWPYPELWVWHVPGSRIGRADMVAYDEETGFALATGLVDKGKEVIAEGLMAFGELRVSHGMPPDEITRNKEDASILTRYRSREISPLPAGTEANHLTEFNFTEVNMALPQPKKDFLKGVGFSDEAIANLEANMKSKAATAEELGLEKKENPAAQEPPAQPATEAEQGVTRDDLVNLVQELGGVIKGFNERIAAIETGMTELKEKSVVQQLTPAASLTAALRSAIGDPANQVRANTKEAKDAPAETPAQPAMTNMGPGVGVTGIPIVDVLIGRAGVPQNQG